MYSRNFYILVVTVFKWRILTYIYIYDSRQKFVTKIPKKSGIFFSQNLNHSKFYPQNTSDFYAKICGKVDFSSFLAKKTWDFFFPESCSLIIVHTF